MGKEEEGEEEGIDEGGNLQLHQRTATLRAAALGRSSTDEQPSSRSVHGARPLFSVLSSLCHTSSSLQVQGLTSSGGSFRPADTHTGRTRTRTHTHSSCFTYTHPTPAFLLIFLIVYIYIYSTLCVCLSLVAFQA